MLKPISYTSAAIMALALMQPIGANAGSVTITASGSTNPSYAKDATIFQNNTTNSNGAGPGIFAGGDGGGSPRRGLLWFDMSQIPAGKTITAVQLDMRLGMVAGSGGCMGMGCSGDPNPRNVSLHKLTNGMWGEGTTGNTATMIGGTGQGFAANTGDATWLAYEYNVTGKNWSAGGAVGDYNGTASATTSVGITAPATCTWTTTAALVSDVQSWYSGSSPNYGWILINADEWSSRTHRAFYTKEAEALNAANWGPVLTVTYTP